MNWKKLQLGCLQGKVFWAQESLNQIWDSHLGCLRLRQDSLIIRSSPLPLLSRETPGPLHFWRLSSWPPAASDQALSSKLVPNKNNQQVHANECIKMYWYIKTNDFLKFTKSVELKVAVFSPHATFTLEMFGGLKLGEYIGHTLTSRQLRMVMQNPWLGLIPNWAFLRVNHGVRTWKYSSHLFSRGSPVPHILDKITLAPKPVIRVALQNHSSPIHHEDLQVMPTKMPSA